MGRRRFQGHSGQHHQPMGRLRVFFLLIVAVRVWPLFLHPRGHIRPGTPAVDRVAPGTSWG
jgi:hypothetical protein